MKVLISTQTGVQYDGKHYYGNSARAVYRRYKEFGDECRLICHRIDVQHATNDILDSDVQLRFFKKTNTIKGFLHGNLTYNDKLAEEQVKWAEFCIVHLPSDNGYQVIKYCRRYNKPYLTVVCGCPWDAYWNHGWQGKLLAPIEYMLLKRAQKEAPYTIYVTNEFLQKRYPTNGVAIGCSNVEIHTGIEGILEKRIEAIRHRENEKRKLKIGTAAALDVAYKGQEYVIKAVAELRKEGIELEYHLIGRGDDSRLRAIAESCGVKDDIFFHGAIPHDEVLDFLDGIDIYIQPSKQEGLPRAMIEAMSRGCLCIGSKTAGIPELVEPRFIFNKGDVRGIVDIIRGITQEDMKEQARSNYECAKEYDVELLNERRNKFIRKFKSNYNL